MAVIQACKYGFISGLPQLIFNFSSKSCYCFIKEAVLFFQRHNF